MSATDQRLVLEPAQGRRQVPQDHCPSRVVVNADVDGCMVTIDAMGYQQGAVQTMRDQCAVRVPALKGNQAAIVRGRG